MKILHGVVSLNPGDGGPARSIPALANATAMAGADVVVCSQHPAKIDQSAYPNTSFVAGSISDAVDTFQPDLIHDHGIWLRSNHRTVRTAIRKGIPLVVSPRGMLEKWCLNHHRYRKTLAWYCYQRRDIAASIAVHATSEAEVASVRNLKYSQPVVQIPNGVSLPSIDPAPLPVTNKKHLVFVSRIHPVKGLEHLLEGWAKVRPNEWTLSLNGPAENGYDIHIRNMIHKLNLEDSVSLGSALNDNDKWQQLKSADAVVLPSFSENFGIVVAESLLMGTPVLTTTGTPWSELVDRECGWTVSPNSAGIQEGLSTIACMPRQQLAHMGQQGRKWMTSDFLWEGIGRRMLAAYEWLLQKDSNNAVRPADIITQD